MSETLQWLRCPMRLREAKHGGHQVKVCSMTPLDRSHEAGKNRVMEADVLSREPVLVPLDDIGLLRFQGPDVIGFLQGYLTSDATELGDDPKFTAICNIRGRTVCTGYAWLDGQTVTLALHRSLCPVVQEFLWPYLAFSRTRLSDASEESLVIGVLENAGQAIAGVPAPVRRLDDARQLALLQGNAPVEADAERDAARRASWDLAAIEGREVWLTADTSGEFLPQMIGLDEIGAVSFSKGCYLGQEVVARAQHLGEVKRRLAALDWSGVPPSPGTRVEVSGRRVGTVVGVAGSAEEGAALAVLRAGQSGPFTAPQSSAAFVLRD
ncbi:MAG: hypothetical protein OXI90_01400 [Gammaproteobacteria bacterium]|nr:hypothetical protein [Gammaproteobacteria bacterium]